MNNIDKYRGCLMGGAIGDALGYDIEFSDESTIRQKYGEQGITEYPLINGIAPVSDDTQMTLFTAAGLLTCTTMEKSKYLMAKYPHYIALSYKDWLKTQAAETFGFQPPEYSWLNNIPEMNHSREPGRTCISTLMHNNLGSVSEHKNNSKGCGGIMRVAPIGLYFDIKDCTIDEIDMLGAEAAALTHGHELGYIPAAMFVHIINLLSHNENISILEAVLDSEAAVSKLFSESAHLKELLDIINKAIKLASDHNKDSRDAIKELGQGWTAEETLAIALYCSLRYQNDFEKAITASVNHGGDSDSTGSVTGNILGAYLGMKGIPTRFLTNLELKDTIIEIADDLYEGCKFDDQGHCIDSVWERKYISHTYPKQ